MTHKTPIHSRAMRRGLYRKAAPMMALMVRKSMEAEYTSVGLHCVQADHQSSQTELLARLAYLLGMGAEIARAIPVAGDNRPGLHQALATVVDMAVDGHRWDSSWGAQLSLAADISIDLFCSYRNLARRFEPGARLLSRHVMAGSVSTDVIRPVEFPNGNELA